MMPRFTIKIKDKYFHWSTIVDAPITDGMNLEDFRKWYKYEYSSDYNEKLFDKMIDTLTKYPAANGNGNPIADTIDEAIRCNRAGKNESYLTAEQIYEQYKEII